MAPEITILIAVAGPALAAAVTWGAIGARLRQLEREVGKIEAMQTRLAEVDSRARGSSESQGHRLGDVEEDVAVLKGRFEGFERGFASGRRSRTAAQGHPIGGEKGGG